VYQQRSANLRTNVRVHRRPHSAAPLCDLGGFVREGVDLVPSDVLGVPAGALMPRIVAWVRVLKAYRADRGHLRHILTRFCPVEVAEIPPPDASPGNKI